MVVEHVDAFDYRYICVKERSGFISIFDYRSHLYIMAFFKFRIYLFRFDELASCVFYMGVAWEISVKICLPAVVA